LKNYHNMPLLKTTLRVSLQFRPQHNAGLALEGHT
jgi:hypothetical protein